MADTKADVKKIKCPDCGEEEIPVAEEIEVGDIWECENCAAEVEVINDDPLEVRLLIEEK